MKNKYEEKLLELPSGSTYTIINDVFVSEKKFNDPKYSWPRFHTIYLSLSISAGRQPGL